jgi:hypothetical protein
MGMPCEVNSILKLSSGKGYPNELVAQTEHHATKSGYRILPIDVPIPLVDENWIAYADVVIDHLTWHHGSTQLRFKISRIYPQPIVMKD